LIGSVTEDADE